MKFSGKSDFSTNGKEPGMRIFLFSVCIVLAVTSGALAQMEKGMERLGLSGSISTVDRQNIGSLDFKVGDLLTRNVELDVELAMTFRDFLQNPDCSVRGGMIYHLFPKEKTVPGIGFSAGIPFLSSGDATVTVFSAFFNLDYFATPNWAFNLKTGYERLDFSTGMRNYDGMVMRFGFSVFMGREESGAKAE